MFCGATTDGLKLLVSQFVFAFKLASAFQMEFIDVSQLSFIHDLGPKGL